MEEVDAAEQTPSNNLQPDNICHETDDEKPLGESDDKKMNGEESEGAVMDSAETEAPPCLSEDGSKENAQEEHVNMESEKESDTVVEEEEYGIHVCTANTNQNNNEEMNSVPDKMTMSGQVESAGEADETQFTDVQCSEISVNEKEKDDSVNNICEHANLEEERVTSNEFSEGEKSEHAESDQTMNINLSCNGHVEDTNVQSENESEEQSKFSSQSNDSPAKSLLQSDTILNERISSDGGSVEIAEEAEEDCSSSGQTHTDNRTLPPQGSGNDASNSILHSKEVPTSSSVTIETKDTGESPHRVESSIPTSRSDDCQSMPPKATEEPACNQSSPASNKQETNSDQPNGSGVARSHFETGDDVEDDLLSELAAELDKAVPGKTVRAVPVRKDLPSETRSSAKDDRGECLEGADDIVKLKRLVQDWKKKYCHAEAELQSLQATANAKAHQQEGFDEERLKIEEGVKKETAAVRKVHLLRIQELEKEVEQKKKENAAARDRQISHDSAAKKAINQLQHEMVHRVDQVKHMYEDAVKEKENMVIRYAKSERENLDLKKAKGELEKKRRDAGQGLEVVGTHNKQLKAERAKLISDMDAKDLEIAKLQKEKEEMEDDVSSVGIKVKWAQNKLKTELESHKDTKVKLAKTEQRLQEAKEETEQIRKNCQEMISTYQESEEIRSNSLDIQLKEKEEELKLHFQEKEDHMELHNTRVKELTSLKKAHHDTLSELDSLKVKAKCLEDERLHTEGLLTQFKGLLNSQKEENRKLTRQMDELKSLKRQLDESKENVGVLEKNIASRKEDEKDLESELERSRGKESELLQFTERMTAKNAGLHSDNNVLGVKVDKFTEECRNLTSELEEAKSEISQLTADLNQEKQYREREAALLSARLSEKTKTLDQVKVQLDDAKDETKTLKRKNAANLKDLTRQLQLAKKKIESLESDGGAPVNHKDNFSSESRTSSTGSLDTLGNSALNGGTINISSGSSGGGSVGRQEDSPQAGQDHTVAIAGGNDFPGIDKAMLVDRIVKLQKQMQRKAEKIEFLQEHNSQLIEELQKKSKIIQQYIMREEAGALVPATSDVNKQKLVRKTMAQMSKQTGIMASLYRSQPVDPNMTLDLSLEINHKLQAVLEDTLLKNITLKENIDTLGQEIARLSEEARFTSSRRSNTGRKK